MKQQQQQQQQQELVAAERAREKSPASYADTLGKGSGPTKPSHQTSTAVPLNMGEMDREMREAINASIEEHKKQEKRRELQAAVDYAAGVRDMHRENAKHQDRAMLRDMATGASAAAEAAAKATAAAIERWG